MRLFPYLFGSPPGNLTKLLIPKAGLDCPRCSFKFQNGFLLPTPQTPNLFLLTLDLCPGNKNIQSMAYFYFKVFSLYQLMWFSRELGGWLSSPLFLQIHERHWKNWNDIAGTHTPKFCPKSGQSLTKIHYFRSQNFINGKSCFYKI